jgi:hypothetical protein
LSGQSYKTGHITTEIACSAGSDLADAISLRAMLSCHIGLLTQISSALGDTATTGTL